jgi:hypothetical protein
MSINFIQPALPIFPEIRTGTLISLNGNAHHNLKHDSYPKYTPPKTEFY